MSRSLCRLAVTALSTAAVSLVALAPSPALASSMSFYKSSGTFAATSWVEMGELPGVAPGNAHIGFLTVEQTSRGRASAFGAVFDLSCPAGAPIEVPGGGHHGEEPPPPAEGPVCVIESVREMEGRNMPFSMDRKFTSATLGGSLAVGEHGGPTIAPAVNISWTGVGVMSTSTDSARYSNEYGTGSFRYTSTSRDAVIATGSRIGGMVFDDEDGETSEGSLGSFRAMSRDRS